MRTVKQIARMSTEELMQLDIITLKRYLIRVQNVVNKRVRRLLERGGNTPATIKLIESGGLISTKNIIDQQVKMQMISEIKRGTDFLNSSTGSVRSYIKGVKEISKRTGLTYDPVTTPRVMADAVAIFNKIKELDPAFVIAITSPKLREYINDFVEEISGTVDDIVNWILEHKDQVYENHIPKQKEYAEWLYTQVSDDGSVV